VGAGGKGAGHRLHVDVAEVAQGEPQRGEGGIEQAERHAGLHGDQVRAPVRGDELRHLR